MSSEHIRIILIEEENEYVMTTLKEMLTREHRLIKKWTRWKKKIKGGKEIKKEYK